MRAFRLTSRDKPPVMEDITVPKRSRNEALVKIHCAALNHRDVYITQGKYPGIRVPITLGSDGCGEVVEAAEASVHKKGQRVVLYPALHWGADESFQGPDFQILGLPRDGTFAEYITIPSECLFKVPEHLTPEAASALPLAGLTAWRALMTRGALGPNNRVLITGIGGGVALAAMQFAIAFGADTFVTSSRQEKLDRAVAMGAYSGALYTENGWRETLSAEAGGGFDVIIDGAGGDGFGVLARLLNPGGRLVFYGGTRGKWPQMLPQHLFYKQISILASTMGSPSEFRAMLNFVAKHKLVPTVDSITPIDEALVAFNRLESGQQFGKLVLGVAA